MFLGKIIYMLTHPPMSHQKILQMEKERIRALHPPKVSEADCLRIIKLQAYHHITFSPQQCVDTITQDAAKGLLGVLKKDGAQFYVYPEMVVKKSPQGVQVLAGPSTGIYKIVAFKIKDSVLYLTNEVKNSYINLGFNTHLIGDVAPLVQSVSRSQGKDRVIR